jgi:Ribosomal protein L5
MSEKKETKKTAATEAYQPRLKVFYNEKVLPALLKKLGEKSPMAAPKLEKIVINIGVSDAREDIKFVDIAREDVAAITGQAAQIRRAKKSISNFKLREGLPVGVRVTLRGDKMYEFFDRFVNIVSPRIRDFQGFSAKCFDGRGNLNIGIKEHYVFPEISVEKSPKPHGMNITFVTNAKNDEKGRMLMDFMGFPFKKEKETTK